MKQSEKLLLGVLAVVCCVAGYSLLFEPEATTAKVEQVAAKFESFAAELRARVDEKALTPAEEYTMEMLVAEVPASPFYARSTQFYFEDNEEEPLEFNDILYSGYLRFGERILAIINGIEYAVGDVVAENGMRVISISREFVSLERKDENTGRISTRKIPLVEDDMEQITLRRARK